MASSSTTPIQEKYDVFISFRGTDTRDNILSHLYAGLCGKKIVTFIDDKLERGDDISDALLNTIEESKISVILFSENYGDSSWCLDELVKIMECKEENGQIVIPVFYKVKPSHVRKQEGTFGEALARYDDHPKIQTWREALTKAADLSGWDSQDKRPDATLVKDIVADILDKLFRSSSRNFGDLVGMSSHFERIESLLSTIKKEVRIIGLWGMGGIGKTTLAKEFFNHYLSQFEGYYIVEDIGQKCEINELRGRLVGGILKDEHLNVGTPNLGMPFIKHRLRRTKVLIVLDDVNDFQHIELLVGQCDCFGPGSIIIITSRDKQVLNGRVDRIYEVPTLAYNESRCLFSRYAFQQERPADGYWRLSQRAIEYANGHPLALKILGSYLYGRRKEEQEGALMKLERTPDKLVQEVLLVSYNGLDQEEKEVFLSIACFFEGESVEDFKCLTHANPFTIRVLVDKCLITIDRGIVRMHDLLREMGRQIFRDTFIEAGKRSWLWDHDDLSHVLTNNIESEAVKGIWLDTFESRITFKNVPNLEYLKIQYTSLPHGLEYLPNTLRYLHWQVYPLRSLPSNFRLENLVMLKMPWSHVKRLWNGRQNLVHLKQIDLSFSVRLIEIPDLSLAANLRTLNLGLCQRLKKFPEVPLGIEYLILSGTGIEDVPSSICNLTSLIKLDLSLCIWLNNISTSIYEWIQHRNICLKLPSDTGGSRIFTSSSLWFEPPLTRFIRKLSMSMLTKPSIWRGRLVKTFAEQMRNIFLYIEGNEREHQQGDNAHLRELTGHPCGDPTQFSSEQGFTDDDIEQSVMQEADGGYNYNSCDAGNPVEELPLVLRRRKKMKWDLNKFNTFNTFNKSYKFLRVRRKSSRKVSRTTVRSKRRWIKTFNDPTLLSLG